MKRAGRAVLTQWRKCSNVVVEDAPITQEKSFCPGARVIFLQFKRPSQRPDGNIKNVGARVRMMAMGLKVYVDVALGPLSASG